MSDGGRPESIAQKQDVSVCRTLTSRASSDEYGRAISKIAAAQICESVGFDGYSVAALESLSDIAIRWIGDLGKASKFHANLAGRTDSNVFDIIQGLVDLGQPADGYLGSGEGSQFVTKSGVVKEIMDYVGSAQEVPFAQAVPHFPVATDGKAIPSFLQMGETPSFKHIPAWLPAFPDPHTYLHTPVWNERASDPREDKIELARQRRKAERSLLSLQQRLVRSSSAEALTSEVTDHWKEAFEVIESEKPVLAKPLHTGDKEDVSLTVLPDKLSDEADGKNEITLLETFAPAVEAMKDGLSEISESDIDRNLPNKRSAVCLEFKSGKKVVGESLDLRLRRKASGRKDSWFRRDEERDDKKRRAELILRQSMENQQDLTQL